MSLKRNIIKSKESWFHIIDSLQMKVYEYFDLAHTRNWNFQAQNYPANGDKSAYKLLASYGFTLADNQITHTRLAYGILDVFGDYGGV